jgi:spermidine synthase
LDNTFSSASYLDVPPDRQTSNPFEYLDTFIKSGEVINDQKDTLLIGGGAMSFPRIFINTYPDSHMDVVEIDPKQIELADTYFGYDPSDKITLHYEDGRTYMNNNQKKYDAIYIDAFNSIYSIPFHLTTTEFYNSVSDSLNEKGILVINVISAVEGDKGKFTSALVNTMIQSFNEVFVVKVTDSLNSDTQNLVIMASKSPEPYIEVFLQENNLEFVVPYISDAVVLTDDFAPVEELLGEVVKDSLR